METITFDELNKLKKERTHNPDLFSRVLNGDKVQMYYDNKLIGEYSTNEFVTIKDGIEKLYKFKDLGLFNDALVHWKVDEEKVLNLWYCGEFITKEFEDSAFEHLTTEKLKDSNK